MADKTTKHRLVFETVGVQPAVAAVDQVTGSLERVDAGLGELGVAAAGGVRRLRSEFDSGEREVERFTDKTEVLIDTMQRLDRVEASPSITVEERGLPRAAAATRGGGGLDTVDRLGSLGSQVFSAFDSPEIANAAGLMGDLAGGIEQVGIASTVALGGLGLASLAVTATFAQWQKEAEELADAARAAEDERINALLASIDEELAVRRIVRTETAEQNRENLDFVRDNARLLQNAALIAEDEVEALQLRLSQLQSEKQLPIAERRGLVEITNEIADTEARLEAARSRSAETNQVYVEAQAEVEARTAAVTRFAQGLVGQLGELASGALPTVQAVVQDVIQSAYEQAEAQRLANSEKEKEIALNREAAAAAAEALAQGGVTDAVDNLFAARTDLVEATHKLALAEAASADSAEKSAERIEEINADAADKRGKTLEKARAAELEAEQDHLREIDEINRRQFTSERAARRARDVVGAIQAQERADEERRKEALNQEKQLERVEASLDDQLDAIDDNARRALQVEQRRAQDEQGIRAQAVGQARVELVNAANAEIALQKQVNVAQQNQQISHFQNLESVAAAGTQKIVNAMIAEFGKGLSRVGGSGAKSGLPQVTSSLGAAFPFAHQPLQRSEGISGRTYVFNISGQSRQQVMRQIDSRVREVLE